MYDELIAELRQHHCDAKEADTQEVCEECAYDVIIADESVPSGIASVCVCGLMHRAADAIEELQQCAELYKGGGETAKKAAETYKAAYIAEHDARVAELRRWVHVTERLPESGGSYIVYLRLFKGKTDTDYVIGDLSYPTEMYFDKGQMLWVGENESYNAILSAVDTKNEYHVTHWMPLPEPPKEET